jgi:hypothetical protein
MNDETSYQKLGRKDLPVINLGGVESFRGLDGGSVGSIGAVQDMLMVREPVSDISLGQSNRVGRTHLLRR